MKIEYEEEALREIVKGFSLTKIMSSLPGVPGAERKLLWRLRSGWPADKAYWKFASHGSCQDIFFLTKIEKVADFFEALWRVTSSERGNGYGFYIQPIEYGRACHFECNLYYNRSDPKAGRNFAAPLRGSC